MSHTSRLLSSNMRDGDVLVRVKSKNVKTKKNSRQKHGKTRRGLTNWRLSLSNRTPTERKENVFFSSPYFLFFYFLASRVCGGPPPAHSSFLSFSLHSRRSYTHLPGGYRLNYRLFIFFKSIGRPKNEPDARDSIFQLKIILENQSLTIISDIRFFELDANEY